MRRLVRLLPYAAGILIVLALPRVTYPVLALDLLLWGLFAVSVDLLLGFVGLLSFGHAMVTLAFAQMLFYVANEWRAVTGGENGVQGVPRTLLELSVGRSIDFYYASVPLVLLGFALAYRIVHSPFGHVLVAIRDNEARAQSLGYPTWRYKLVVFMLSGGIAGLAGALFALGHGFASLELLHWTTSGTAVLMTILGGIGTLWGSLLGAAVVLLVRDALSSAPEASGVITGAIFVVIVLAFRHGLWPTAGLAARKLRALAARSPEWRSVD